MLHEGCLKTKPSELLVDSKIGTVVDALKDMLRTGNVLNKFEKQDRLTYFVKSHVADT